jgi:hypothetical protein
MKIGMTTLGSLLNCSGDDATEMTGAYTMVAVNDWPMNSEQQTDESQLSES